MKRRQRTSKKRANRNVVLSTFLVISETWSTSTSIVMLTMVIYYYFFPEYIINIVMIQPNEYCILTSKCVYLLIFYKSNTNLFTYSKN